MCVFDLPTMTYSHKAPALNLHVAGSQQLLGLPPVSQSSPSSLIPLPHILSVVTLRDPGSNQESVSVHYPALSLSYLPNMINSWAFHYKWF